MHRNRSQIEIYINWKPVIFFFLSNPFSVFIRFYIKNSLWRWSGKTNLLLFKTGIKHKIFLVNTFQTSYISLHLCIYWTAYISYEKSFYKKMSYTVSMVLFFRYILLNRLEKTSTFCNLNYDFNRSQTKSINCRQLLRPMQYEMIWLISYRPCRQKSKCCQNWLGNESVCPLSNQKQYLKCINWASIGIYGVIINENGCWLNKV
jgi:hypothetical protein